MTKKNQNGRRPKKFKMEDELKKFKMEDDLKDHPTKSFMNCSVNFHLIVTKVELLSLT